MDYLKQYQSFFTYSILTPPASLPVSLADVKTHLRLDPADASQDSYLTLLINAAAEFCEEYTDRTLLNTEFRAFRNFFAGAIELRRSPFVSIEAFEYSVNDAFVAVGSSLYYATVETDFSKIILRNNETYPSDGDDVLQGIRIDFIAGYGIASTDIPPKLYLAILNHIAFLYENRGDCDLDPKSMQFLPATTQGIYNLFKIPKIT